MAAEEKEKQSLVRRRPELGGRDREKSLRVAVERQLLAAAERVVRLLQERPSSGGRQLRRMVMDAVAAAVERIFSEYQAVAAGAGAGAEVEPSTPERDCPPGFPAHDGPRDVGGKPHRCRVCGKSFGRKGFLIRHADNHVDDMEPACGLCGVRATCGEDLRPHLQTHRDSNRTCVACGKKFPSARAREAHRQLHAGAAPFSCRVGSKQLDQKTNMTTRVLTPFPPPTQNAQSPRTTTGTDDHVPTAPMSPHQDHAADSTVDPSHRRGQQQEADPSGCRLRDRLREHVQDAVQEHVGEERFQDRVEDGGPKCVRTFQKADRSSHSLQVEGQGRSGGAIEEQVQDGVEDRVQDHREKRVRGLRDRPFPKSSPASSCSERHKGFPRRGALDRQPFICEFCGKTFTENAALKRHLKRHTGGRPRVHGCDECGKKFTMSQHLHVHMRIHTGEKPYACRVCGKTFRQVGNLDAHAKIHTGEKAFVCSLCGKSFRQKISLETHERFHRKDKVFACHACDKSFVQKVDLKRHMLTHSGEKPHVCRICQKRYQEKRSLEAHMKAHVATAAGGGAGAYPSCLRAVGGGHPESDASQSQGTQRRTTIHAHTHTQGQFRVFN